MKTIGRSILLAGVLAAGASGAIAQTNTWADDWYKAKFGRNTPAVDARLAAERENTAFRAETAPEFIAPAATPFEQWYKAKFGRTSPREEARLNAERENTAFREEPAHRMPAVTSFDDWYKAKHGRSPASAGSR